MTIEFPCPECAQLVRTPDAAAGKKGKCPSCAAVVVIPGGTNSAPAAAPAKEPVSQPAVPATPSAAAPEPPIEFFCFACGNQVRTPRAAAGKKGKCPRCGEVVNIPLPKSKDPAPAKGTTTGSLKTSPPKPAMEKPAAEKPVAEKPAAEKPVVKPTTTKPASSPPTAPPPSAPASTAKPAPAQPAASQPAAPQPTAPQPTIVPGKKAPVKVHQDMFPPALKEAPKPAAKLPADSDATETADDFDLDPFADPDSIPTPPTPPAPPAPSKSSPAVPSAAKPAPKKPAPPPVEEIGMASFDEPKLELKPKAEKPAKISGDSSVSGIKPLAPLQPLTPLTPLTPLAPVGGPVMTPVDPLLELTPLTPLGAPGFGAPGFAPIANNPFGDPYGGPAPSYSAPAPSYGAAPYGAAPYGGYGVPPANAFQPAAYQPPPGYGPGPMQPAGPSDLALMLPAILQLVVLAPYLLYTLYGLVMNLRTIFTLVTVTAYASPTEQEHMTRSIIVSAVVLLIIVIFLICQGVIVYGSICMMQRRSHGNALAAGWMSLIPCINPLGLPFGIWSLVVLNQHQVKRAFR